MSPELYEAVLKHGAIIDLSNHAKFLLTGADRVRYLNGQLTNDVRKASSRHVLHACVTNAKGRVEADVRLHVSQTGGAGLWLDAEPGLREPLALRLERYIVADDVTLEDVSEAWQLHHLFGKAAEPWLPRAGTEGILAADRFDAPGVDIWQPASSSPPQSQCGGPQLSTIQANTLRILLGIPRWPEELHQEVFPQEAGLETSAMDFHKGCYIGQEILSRIKTTGKMPRKLIRFRAPYGGFQHLDDFFPSPSSWQLALPQPDGSRQPVGAVTSIAAHPMLDHLFGLAYVRQSLDPTHSLLLVTEAAPKIAASAEIIPSS